MSYEEKQPETVDIPVYLLVEPKWKDRRWYADQNGRQVLEGGQVVRATKGRPGSIRNGGVVVKVTLRMPASSFLPLQPEAVVVVRPEDAETIIVETSDPRLDEEA